MAVVPQMWAALCDLTVSHDRNPDALTLVVRANVTLFDHPIDGERPSFCGSIEQIAEDLAATEATGAHEVVLDLHHDATAATDVIELADLLVEAASLRRAA